VSLRETARFGPRTDQRCWLSHDHGSRFIPIVDPGVALHRMPLASPAIAGRTAVNESQLGHA
jgi:hypothetical protein